MKLRVLILALGLWGGAQARPLSPWMRSNLNCRLECQDLPGVSQKLKQLCQSEGGQITNFNLDTSSGSGNFNLRVPEERLSEFTSHLHELGQVLSENQSVSDNTVSYEEQKRQMDLAQKMLTARWTVQGEHLSEAEKAQFDAEYKSYLRDRVNSNRSSLASYESMRGWADVSISLSGPRREGPPLNEPPPECSQQRLRRCGEATEVECSPCTAAAPQGICPMTLSLGLGAVLMMGLGLYLRRSGTRPRVDD